MEQPNVYNSKHLANLGIDKRFIEAHAGDMNRHFNKIYDEYRGTAPQPTRQIEGVSTQSVPIQGAPFADPQQLGQAMHAQKQQLTQEFTAMLNDLAQQFTRYSNEMEKRLEQLEQRNKQLEQQISNASQTPAFVPAQQPAQAQQESVAAQQPEVAPVQNTVPAQAASQQEESEAVRRLRQEEAYRDSVAIDKMFNFSGQRKGQGPVRN